MKKLFALFMVVAMLSVAGTAMATSITANPTEITIQRGNTATVSVTGTASHGGELSYSLVYGTGTTSEWASLSGTTVTLTAPSSASAGFYTVIVRVTETYTDPSDIASHGTPAPRTDTADVQITVNVTVPAATPNQGGGSSSANSNTIVVLDTKETVVSAVKVIAVAVVNVVTSDAITTPSVQQQVVQQTINAIATALRAINSAIPASAPVRSSTNVAVVQSSTFTGNVANDIASASARLKQKSGNDTKRAIGVAPSFTAAEAGFQPIDLPKFDKAFYGKKPGIDLGARGKVGGSFFASDATGGNEAVFLDSTGAQTEVIPGENASNGAEAGVVTAVVYVEAGEEYDPIITTEVAPEEEAAFEQSTGTTTEATVTIEEFEYAEVTINRSATFNPVVSDARVVSAVSAQYGKTVSELPYDTASTTKTWSASTEETSYMTNNNLVFVSSLPVLENIPDGTYIAAITFDNTPTRDVVGAPKFYPNGVSATGAATSAKVYTYANGSATEVTAANAKSVVTNGRAAYLVFEVANGAVATADFEASAVTLNKPAIVVSNTDSDNSGGNNDEEPLPVGGSSGGCSAGSAVLALAVLGTFIATRKK